MITFGIILAIVAMFAWGFGDFLMQKSIRKIGDWETLFFISLIGSIVLIPFCYNQVGELINNLSSGGLILLITCITITFAAIIDFEALKNGKLSIVEPIWSLEIPAAAVLAYLILGERISLIEFILIALLIVFLVLVAFRETRISKKAFLEKGVIMAIIGALLMGATNFFMGWGARVTDPITVNFIMDTFLMIISFIVLILRGRSLKTSKDIGRNIKILLPMALFDKIAWLAFAFSMILAPIAIATALSESYIIIVVLLGIFINKERLLKHQKIGMVGAVLVVIILAVIGGN